MPHLTLDIKNGACVLNLLISTGLKDYEAHTRLGVKPKAPVACRAIIDTGARSTVIDSWVFKKLGILPKRQKPMSTPTTTNEPVLANVFDVGIHLQHPGTGQISKPYELVHDTEVYESSIVPQFKADVLLGMDVLARCLLVVDGLHQRFSLAI